jgi:hypothetical protein
MSELSVAEAARLYTQAGWPVLPLHDLTAGCCSCSDGPTCRVAGKHPRVRTAHHAATRNLRKIEAWWGRWPHANIGIATGGPRGLVVVDLDDAAGQTNWQRLIAEHGYGPETATALTPHGEHRWYRMPSGLSVPRRIGSIAEHVDILGDGGYAIVPPSFTDTMHPDRHQGECSGQYQWAPPPRRALTALPAWVAELANQRERTDSTEVDSIEQATPAPVRKPMQGEEGAGTA